MHTINESGDWDFSGDIEKFWRERFADQLYTATPQYLDTEKDSDMLWFLHGYSYAISLLRHGRDELGMDYDRSD